MILLFKLTVIAVFEKIVSVIVVILLSCLYLFRGDVLLRVWNKNSKMSVFVDRFCDHNAQSTAF